MKFKRLERPWKLIAVSGQDHLAVRSGIVALVDKSFPVRGANNIQVIEFISKKQSRVCRSTYSAELYSALDIMGLLINISLVLAELLTGPMSAKELEEKFETGDMPLQTELVIDAASVFDSVASKEPKIPTDASMTIHMLSKTTGLSAACKPFLVAAEVRCIGLMAKDSEHGKEGLLYTKIYNDYLEACEMWHRRALVKALMSAVRKCSYLRKCSTVNTFQLRLSLARAGYQASDLNWRPSLVGWNPLLVGWRPWRRLEAIATRLAAIASTKKGQKEPFSFSLLTAEILESQARTVKFSAFQVSGFSCLLDVKVSVSQPWFG